MARMKAIEAAVRVLEKEGITCAFGVPGAAINPLYAALKARGSIRHILARHVDGERSDHALGLFGKTVEICRGALNFRHP